MVAGRLQEKKGLFYMVLSYNDMDGKRQQPWFPTGLPVKGNKKRAEKMLSELRSTFKIPTKADMDANILFADYLEEWLEIAKSRVKIATYSSYSMMIKKTIAPYFRQKKIKLKELEARHIQSFYTEQLRRVKPNTVIHYHANIHSALKYAVRTDRIPVNPADKIDRPKKNDFSLGFYDSDEMEKLFAAVKGHKLEVPIMLGSFYGLRREEVVGLKWNAIDFEQETLTIRHTVTSVTLDGKVVIIEQDSAKTKSSMRTLPLVESFKAFLLQVKEAQEVNKKICGNAYNYDYDGYICVDELGNRIKPGYITTQFPKLLEKHGLRRIRFHDLRHSCASLLIANGVPMKQIQEWLGHSDFSTTANIYAHLDYSSKVSSAKAMERGLKLPENSVVVNRWE